MPYITSTTPKKYKLTIYRFLNLILAPIGRYLLGKKFNHISITGTEHLKGSPKLLVMNHSCPLDPVLITFFGREPLQFLITEPFMQGSLGSKVASFFGQITKRKLDFDPSSIQFMKKWSECGASVALFPEGQFSWDGSTSPLMPGLDQLIKYLKLPVVCVHLAGGNRVKPAWASKMRKTTITMTIHSPITLAGEKDILQSIKDRIFPEPVPADEYPSEGSDLALGLARIVRFCPKCEADQSLSEAGNILSCSSCGESYEIDANNGIKNSPLKSVKDLFDHTYRFIDSNPSVTSVGQVSLFDVTKKEWVFMMTDKLTVSAGGLKLGEFHLKPEEIIDHTLDWGEIIIIKTRQQRYTLKLPMDSRLVFDYALKKARHA